MGLKAQKIRSYQICY